MLIKFRYQIITDTRFDFVIELFTGTFATSLTFTTDNAHRKLQHVLCQILFCSLGVLGFISLEYSSLQVHILRIPVLHYEDTSTEYEQEIEILKTDNELPVL
jgi:hypothetical protein